MKLFNSIIIACSVLFSASIYASETTIYKCDDGEQFQVAYPNQDSAVLYYKNELFLLKSAVSASGARYTGDSLEWWTKGKEGNLTPLAKGKAVKTKTSKSCHPLKLVKEETVTIHTK
ncbi:MliC family protein [Entomomonas sp. E2T0]|uniref:MliC family protein n=1 Tax=Entomomonas sp. E2T0 TaxID=2930213 RepID=UPI002228322D|nr:MliC family protein [Entomomonas sp. E2T0]UYZ85446.1 MliC family protein [Entomomonas sp. E2T0]